MRPRKEGRHPERHRDRPHSLDAGAAARALRDVSAARRPRQGERGLLAGVARGLGRLPRGPTRAGRVTTATISAMDLNAERAALGGVLLGGVTVLRALGLPTSAFFPESHRAIHRAMIRLVDRCDALDALPVQSQLPRANELHFAGGPGALALPRSRGAIAG